MPTRSIHAPEPKPGVDLLRLLVLALIGGLAVLLGEPRLLGNLALEPQHLTALALGPVGVWLLVDRLEKARFRRARTAAFAAAATVVHRTGILSRAVFPLAVGGVVAMLLATPVGGFCSRVASDGDAGSLAAILIMAGIAIGAAKLVTIARFGLRTRLLELTPQALTIDGHRRRTIPWREVRDARLVMLHSRRSRTPYLALALEEPVRHGLRPVSLWRRLGTSGALPGDVLATNLDVFLDRPEEIVEDVRRFIRRHRDKSALDSKLPS